MDNHRITLMKFEDTAVGEDGVVRLVESSSAADVVPASDDEPTARTVSDQEIARAGNGLASR
jgi:hypothetical protein